MSAKHTPTPWRQPREKASHNWHHIIEDRRGPRRIVAAVARGPAMDDAEARANAEFIVRAVNCHDELVAALNAVLPLAESKAGTDPSLPQWWRNAEMVKRVQQGRAALAHAKGYQP